MAKLFLLDSGTVQEIQIGQELTLGRAYSNLLRLDGEEISRVHAIVYRRGGDYILRDLDSKNGVLLNGQRVVNALIGPDDEIQIGKYVLLFDPSPEFDMGRFLRKHGVRTNGASDDSAAISAFGTETDSAKIPSVAEEAKSQEPIFFSLPEAEGLADTERGAYSPQFLAELLRACRMLATSGPAELEDETLLCQHFLTAAVGALGADRGVVVLKESSSPGEGLRLAAMCPKDHEISVNRVVLRAVLRNTQAVLCNSVMHDERFHRTETVLKESIGSLIAYPIVCGASAVGLLYCDVHERPNAFRREHLIILNFVARILALCLRRTAARY